MSKNFNEMVILVMITTGTYNGILLLNALKKLGIDIPEGTIYPLLRKMRKEGLIKNILGETDTGSSVKCYCLTSKGVDRLSQLKAEWRKKEELVSNIQKIAPAAGA